MNGEELLEKAEIYATRRGLEIAGSLGWGIHGSIWKATVKAGTVPIVLKIHRMVAPYRRERDCYLRLAELGVNSINGVAVPVLLRADDEWLAIEMSLVSRPFLLDFGTAWLDERPDFPAEVWDQLAADAAEKFGDDWPLAQKIIRSLESETGIIMGDVHPGNLALR